jgi:membrane complex biogenesis BtpA family protein
VSAVFDRTGPKIIGVIHLPPLPGSPAHGGSLAAVLDFALRDAKAIQSAGMDGVIVENFGDAPFFADRVPPETIASMAVVAGEVVRSCSLKLGINVLRNDARGALGIAVAVGASFIRVNVHTGVAATDQGIIEGRAAETIRAKSALGTDVAILADIHVKHATLLSQPDIALSAEETAYRGAADGLIVTGATTGRQVDMDQLEKVRLAVPDKPIFVGSGATSDTVAELLRVADGVIVGTAFRPHGDTRQPIDQDAVNWFMDAVRKACP